MKTLNPFFLILLKHFSDFFSISYDTYLLNKYENLNLNSGNIWISYCSFIELNGNLGGAIYYQNNILIRILVEDSIFYECYSNSKLDGYSGGGIFLYSTNGNYILNKICSYSCYTINGYHGQFCFLSTTSSNINQIYLTTVTKSVKNLINIESSPVVINGGNQILHSINISKNKLYGVSAFKSYSVNSLNMNFSTIIDCISTYTLVIYFYSGNERKINHCNIINNTSPSINGIIHNQVAISIFESCIFSNNSNLFVTNTGTITFNFCWIQHNGNLGINIGTNSLFLTETFYITHYSTFLCINSLLKSEKKNPIFYKLIIKFFLVNFFNLNFN